MKERANSLFRGEFITKEVFEKKNFETWKVWIPLNFQTYYLCQDCFGQPVNQLLTNCIRRGINCEIDSYPLDQRNALMKKYNITD